MGRANRDVEDGADEGGEEFRVMVGKDVFGGIVGVSSSLDEGGP
jgi:hypothetical protein